MSKARKGKKLSEEHKQKISDNHADVSKEKHPMWGKGELVSGDKNGMYKKHHTEESKRKISESRKGKYGGKNNPMYGRKRDDLAELNRSRRGQKLSDETKRKLSLAKIGNQNARRKPL